MAAPKTFEYGAALGLITVAVVIICGAMMSDETPEPGPSPTPDRSVVIVPQK